jgi:hypothetical protein
LPPPTPAQQPGPGTGAAGMDAYNDAQARVWEVSDDARRPWDLDGAAGNDDDGDGLDNHLDYEPDDYFIQTEDEDDDGAKNFLDASEINEYEQ